MQIYAIDVVKKNTQRELPQASTDKIAATAAAMRVY
jgi:hypothetical protein